MRISDWSSDVCSSDLGTTAPGIARPLRIAMVSRTLDGEAPHPDVALALRRAADLCYGLGHGVEPVEAIVDGGAAARAFRTIWGYLASEAAARAQHLIPGRARADILDTWKENTERWGRRIASV